jgi:putative transposase
LPDFAFPDAVERKFAVCISESALRGGRKHAIGTRAPMMVPAQPNDRWSLDFVSGQLTDGRHFCVLTIAAPASAECLVLVADTSSSGARVAREL